MVERNWYPSLCSGPVWREKCLSHTHMLLDSGPPGAVYVCMRVMYLSLKLFIEYAFPCDKGMIGHFS